MYHCIIIKQAFASFKLDMVPLDLNKGTLVSFIMSKIILYSKNY